MTTDVEIFALTVKDRQTESGAVEMAFFSCRARGFTLGGCLLTRRSDGRVHMFPPKIAGDNARNSVWIDDPELKQGIMSAALAVYELEGGALAKSGNAADHARAREPQPLQRAS